jgi:flavin-dependent dehydrogenase
LLNKLGHHCQIVERQFFPRFSIGESLLPQCMQFIEQAGMLAAVQAKKFQHKNGARFLHQGKLAQFSFDDQYTNGWTSTFEVVRADFDKVLADQAQAQGVAINYGQQIERVDIKAGDAQVVAIDGEGQEHNYQAKFVLDASGFGRVLPNLLKLEKPSSFPRRQSLFTHIQDNIADAAFDRNKILIAVHPEHTNVWYWLIPFSNGRLSVGVVAEEQFLSNLTGEPAEKLRGLLDAEPDLRRLLRHAEFDTPVNMLAGYSADISQMCGPGYALLGNAGEFLDPIFSSGVTIAMKSASLAATVLDRELSGAEVDWQAEFAAPLAAGVAVFKSFVQAWYDGSLQSIFFSDVQQPRIKQMLCSILAGYVWDDTNPYTNRTSSRLETLAKLCRTQ